MIRTIIIFVNGILNSPENVDSWTDHAVEWVNNKTDSKADKMEYRSGVLTRRWFQSARVENLQSICKKYVGNKIVLVGHSNGCDIIQRLIAKGFPKINEIHLIAAASEADFKKNGFNHALKLNKVEKIFVYMSPIDEALKKAKWSTILFGWLGLGYGYLGLVGPKNESSEFFGRVIVHKEDMGHSQWFSKKNFDNTMRLVTGAS